MYSRCGALFRIIKKRSTVTSSRGVFSFDISLPFFVTIIITTTNVYNKFMRQQLLPSTGLYFLRGVLELF